jgi:hypothetical protein
MLINNFVINSDKYLLPNYLISPFNTEHINQDRNLLSSNIFENYIQKRFKNKYIYYTNNGREAISLAISKYQLSKSDCVSIFTTSENLYISSCVTQEIEKYCNWSRKIEKNTKIIFINHEFGFPYPNVKKFKKYGVPIIEDFAHSFFLNENIPFQGDYCIFSFPKMFPIQIGGLLVSNSELKKYKPLDQNTKSYINNILSKYIINKKDIIKNRINNHKYLIKNLKFLNISPFFNLSSKVIPGVFMFNTPNNINLDEFKIYMNSNGIQSSVFYGKHAYFIPVHQFLTKNDLDYFIDVIKYYFLKQK